MNLRPRIIRSLMLATTIMVVGILVAADFNSPDIAPGKHPPGHLEAGIASGYNVLLVTLDTTRADRLGVYGHKKAATPVMDALAAGGIRFDDAVTTAPVTLPAHASIMTGLDPPNHGVRNNAEFRLDQEKTTLAEVLEDKGYETAAFIASFVLDGRFGLDQGFDTYDDQMPLPKRGFGQDQERSAEVVSNAAISWLGSRSDDKPFFAWVHYYDPHRPYLPHEQTKFTARQSASHQYDGEIAYMDKHLGRLVDALDQHGLRKRTLLIVVGDHGESLGEHHEGSHSRLIYDAVMRVPLIISSPSLIKRSDIVDDVAVSVNDIFPTVIDLLGVPYSGQNDGTSLLDARENRDRILYMESMVPYLDNGWAPLYALRDYHRKFIMAPRPECYLLHSDRSELHNRYEKPDKAKAENCDELESKLSKMLSNWPTAREVASAATALDPETVARLESLGYISVDSADGTLGQLDPKDMMPTWAQLAEASRVSRTGDQLRSLEILEQVLEIWPRDRLALLQLGKTYLRMGRTSESAAAFRKAIEIKPSAEACLLLAQIFIQTGRHEEADTMLSLGTTVEPEHGGIHIARGDLLVAQRKIDEAIASYEKAKNIDPYRAKTVANDRLNRLRRFVVSTSTFHQ